MGFFSHIGVTGKLVMIIVVILLIVGNIINLVFLAERVEDSVSKPATKVSIDERTKYPQFGLLLCGSASIGSPFNVSMTRCQVNVVGTTGPQQPLAVSGGCAANPTTQKVTAKGVEMDCLAIEDKSFLLIKPTTGEAVKNFEFAFTSQSEPVIMMMYTVKSSLTDAIIRTGVKTNTGAVTLYSRQSTNIVLSATEIGLIDQIGAHNETVVDYHPVVQQVDTLSANEFQVAFNNALVSYRFTLLDQFLSFQPQDLISSLSAVFSLSVSIFVFFFPVMSTAENIRVFKFGKKPSKEDLEM